jgi:hypothetical protein
MNGSARVSCCGLLERVWRGCLVFVCVGFRERIGGLLFGEV